MTAASSATTRAAAPHDEVTAVRGAQWIATAAVIVGVLNYVYALVLTRLLDVSAYATFAAGQGLILCVAAIGVVTVPWMLAQALARAHSVTERGDVIRFSVITGAVGGVVAACAVAAVATQFAGPATTLVLALSTLLIYVTRVTVGWLQGTERLRTLATVTTSEAALKLAVGLLLVSALGLGETGALAAFGIAVLPFVICWPYRTRGSNRRWLAVTANRDLWRRAIGVAAIQGLVALMAALDIVMVAVLPTDRSAAASYQASVMIGRIPLFLAGAVAMAFLPALSRRRAGASLAAHAVGMYVTVALPLAAVCATAPGAVLTAVFPSGYGMMSVLMAFTAMSGLALGGLSLVVTFSQAANDYGCLRWQLAGLFGYVVALLVGWHVAGVPGMAVGGACGNALALALLIRRLVRRQGIGVLARTHLLEPLLLVGVLVLLRPHAVLWLVAATATGVWAAWCFFGRRSEPGRPGRSGDESEDERKHIVISTFDYAGNPNYQGGGALVIAKMAHRLSEDFQVTVVTAARRGGTRVDDGVRCVRLPVCRVGPRAGQLLFHAMLPFMARTLRHDLWIESFTPPFSTSFLPLFSRSPVIGIDQGRCGEALSRKYHVPFFLVERVGLRRYRNIVSMNAADADAVRRITPRATVHVIANGVERQYADDDRLGAGDHILFLGRIDVQQKGLDLLLAAYAKGRPAMPLLVAGSGTPAEERKFGALLADKGSGVRRLGHAGEGLKNELLRNSAFLVMPSRHETFGLVALEGMSYGKPVLHFDLPALRWMRGGGGVRVPPFDVDALADRMRRLAVDAERRRTLGGQARLTAQRYTWEEMTGRYLSLAHLLLDSPTAHRAAEKELR